MEEERLQSSLPGIKDPVLDQPPEGLLTTVEHRYVNGEHGAQAQGKDHLDEEAEPWEQLIWPVRSMPCTSPPLSCATVQWDMPDPAAKEETHSLGGSTNELASEDATCPDGPAPYSLLMSLNPPRAAKAELCTHFDREEEDLRLLNAGLQWTGNVVEPCDAADVQEPMTQEEEHSKHELLDEIPQRSEAEGEGDTSTLDAFKSADSTFTVEGTEGSGDESDSYVDVKLEEELGVLLTREGDTEEEHTEEEEDEEEGGEVGETLSATNVSSTETEEAVGSLCDVKIPTESLQTGDTSATVNVDKLIDVRQSEVLEESLHSRTREDVDVPEEDRTGRTEELEMCRDADQNVDPKQSATAVENDEPSVAATDNAERVGNSQKAIEPTEKLEEAHDRASASQEEKNMDPEQLGASIDNDESSVMATDNTERIENLQETIEQTENSLEALHQSSSQKQENVDPEQPGATIVNEEQSLLATDNAERIENLQETIEQTENLEEALDQSASQEVENVDPEQSGATIDNKEPSVLVTDNTESIENSLERVELTDNLEETHNQTASREAENVDPEQLQMAMENKEPLSSATDYANTTEKSQEAVEPAENLEEERLQCRLQVEPMKESVQAENADLPLPEEPARSERTACAQTEDGGEAERQGQTDPSQENEPEKTDEPQTPEQMPTGTEAAPQTAESSGAEEQKEEASRLAGAAGGAENGSAQTDVVSGGGQPGPAETARPRMNGGEADCKKAQRLAQVLFELDGIQRVDVVKHFDKDNDFSRAVGEEYLNFFDFTGQTLDHALRSFLKVVVLIGETQERERVLQHFACRFHQCNPDSFSSSGAVLALTCALMLLNTDLHGQNVGKSMSSSQFVSNLDGMNEGENFSKDLLKSLYNSIKNEPLEWAVDDEELKVSVLVDEDASDPSSLRSKSNPFQDVPHDKTACVVKEGFLQRKIHADIDGKRTPWGKRGWKTFYGVLRGMVLYLQKDDYYKREQATQEEVVSVHHSLAEQAADYTKKPHVFRLQTADWRVFLFQCSSKAEMHLWISRINLVSALHSSPPFPAAVGSQRRFCRPILPASQSAHTLERQLQSHRGMLESFQADLLYLQQQQQSPPEVKRAKAKELEEHRVRAEYLQREMCRYEIYIRVLEAWRDVKKTGGGVLSKADLALFDKDMRAGQEDDQEEEEGLKKAYSSPSLEVQTPTPSIIKVRRNISERRTYRRTIIPRWNKEA